MCIMALDEFKIRQLVNEIAKDILELDEILIHVGITRAEYDKLLESKAFVEVLNQAQLEWKGADNTFKRVRATAGIITEELMQHVFFTARDGNDPLLQKVRALEAIAKIGGYGSPEPAAGSLMHGQLSNVFNLQINYPGGQSQTVSIGATVIEGETYSESDIVALEDATISDVFIDDGLEEL
jgi:hypothetical protein